MSLKYFTVKWPKLFYLLILFSFLISKNLYANCQDPILRQQVAQTAKEEQVDEQELLSVIAHESGCRFYVVAWNKPRQPQTAKAKFFSSIEETKALIHELIASQVYRVDVGIGQINNEAHIQPKGWTLDEVLNPETALKRVAQVLKERGWKNYHSSNRGLARKWQVAALAALKNIDQKIRPKIDISTPIFKKTAPRLIHGPLIVFNASSPFNKSEKSAWIYKNQ